MYTYTRKFILGVIWTASWTSSRRCYRVCWSKLQYTVDTDEVVAVPRTDIRAVEEDRKVQVAKGRTLLNARARSRWGWFCLHEPKVWLLFSPRGGGKRNATRSARPNSMHPLVVTSLTLEFAQVLAQLARVSFCTWNNSRYVRLRFYCPLVGFPLKVIPLRFKEFPCWEITLIATFF